MSNQRAVVPCTKYGLAIQQETASPKIVVDDDWRSGSRMQELAVTIESGIIPRLLISHGLVDSAASFPPSELVVIGPATVQSFVELLMSKDNIEASDWIDGIIERGVPLEKILLELMAPAARLLGDMWTADLCDFVDVTLGLSRMQQLLRKLGRAAGITEEPSGSCYRALLVPAPGEHHTFGLRVVEEFLLRDGWEVRSHLKATRADISQLASEEYYDIVGFSLSGETLRNSLASAIAEVRQVSQNRTIVVMVGGVMFSRQPHLVAEVGADALASDAQDAVRKANAWARRFTSTSMSVN